MSLFLRFALPSSGRLMLKHFVQGGAYIRHLSMSSSDYQMSKMENFMISRVFIDGEFRRPSSGTSYQTFDPATGQKFSEAAEAIVDDAKFAVRAARKALPAWSSSTAKQRGDLLDRLYHLQIENAETLAQLITREMGKPLRESRGEIAYGASFLQWFAQEARRINGEVLSSPWQDRKISYVKEPIGVAGIITPWNFPNAMITRKIGAALAAGCTVVVKPAPETPFSALALAMLAQEAGFPPGVINVVPTSPAYTPSIGSYLCSSPDVAVISFTGSTAVGKLLCQQAVPTMKRMCMELGGDAPFIVFNSADIEKAVEGCFVSKFRNTGQTCVCTNRIFVQDGVYDRFVEALVAKIHSDLHFGPTMDEKTTIGPLVSKEALFKVMTHVEDALELGANLITGGEPADVLDIPTATLYFKPTVLTNITSEMKVFQEETFGPVAAIAKFKTEKDVLKMANNTRFGLAGYFYSRDYVQIERVARHLKVGMVGINEGIISTCEAPFGGIKESGLGREGSHFGVDEYLQVKYICLGGLDYKIPQ